jgi:hypothetical protein
MICKSFAEYAPLASPEVNLQENLSFAALTAGRILWYNFREQICELGGDPLVDLF